MATWSDAFSTRTTHDLELVLLEDSTNSAANTSSVTGRLQINPPSDSTSWSLISGDNSYSFTFNGTTYTGNFTFDFRTNRSTKVLRTVTSTITHNADGSKVVSASGSASSVVLGSASISSKSLTLTDFVRTPNTPSSGPTLTRSADGTTITVVSAVSAALSPAGPSLTDYQYRQSTDGSTWGSAVSMGTDRTIDVTGLTPTTSYYYQTRAVSSEGSSGWSPTTNNIGMPSDLRVAFLDATETPTTTTAIALDWGGYTSNISRYRVSYKRVSDSTWIDTGYSGTTTAYQVTGLLPNTAYDFRVSAENTTAGTSSNYALITSATIPSTPSSLTVTSFTSSTVALDWADDTTGITNYVVEYKKTADSSWTSTGYAGLTSAYTVTGLEFNTPYDFRVASQNTTRGTISAYATISQTTLPAGPPVRSDLTTWSPSSVLVCEVDGEWTEAPNGIMYVCTSTDPEVWTVVG